MRQASGTKESWALTGEIGCGWQGGNGKGGHLGGARDLKTERRSVVSPSAMIAALKCKLNQMEIVQTLI
eukprot:228996-Hanusia_phi.AAC.6